MKQFLFLLLLFPLFSFSQISIVEKADAYLRLEKYESAIKIYEKVIKEDSSISNFRKLAYCYRNTDNWSQAEYWYKKITDQVDYSVSSLYYAEILQINGKCKEAEIWFEKYFQTSPHVPNEFINLCDEITSFASFIVQPIKANSQYDEYAPAFFKDGITFSLNKFDKIGNDHFIFHYGADHELEKISFNLDTSYYVPPNCKEVVFTQNKNGVYLTSTMEGRGGFLRYKVYHTKLQDTTFTELKGLPFNSDDFSIKDITTNKDGTLLFFASDMPGGFGGFDIYYSEYDQEAKKWGFPTNLGSFINSDGNDVSPFYFDKNQELYFSSNGFRGMGGYDILKVRLPRNINSRPKNLGSSINSRYDDKNFIINDEHIGYFSSNRKEGKGGFDIYFFELKD